MLVSVTVVAGEWYSGQVPHNEKFSPARHTKTCSGKRQDDVDKDKNKKHPAAVIQPLLTPAERQACHITVRQAQADAQKGKALFVDVRSADDYAAVHIANALNMPVYTLASRAFLKHRPFIIVDKGYRADDLTALCVDLKKKGFLKVSVLQGGIAAWLQAGYPAEQNDESVRQEIFTLTPRELAATAGKQKWSIVGMGPDRNRIKKIFATERILTGKDYRGQVANTTKSSALGASTAFNPTLVVGTETYDTKLVRSLVRHGFTPVFYLDGGIENYLTYHRVHKQQVEHAAMDRQSLAKCPGS